MVNLTTIISCCNSESNSGLAWQLVGLRSNSYCGDMHFSSVDLGWKNLCLPMVHTTNWIPNPIQSRMVLKQGSSIGRLGSFNGVGSLDLSTYLSVPKDQCLLLATLQLYFQLFWVYLWTVCYPLLLINIAITFRLCFLLLKCHSTISRNNV